LNANRRNFRSEPLVLVALFILAILSFTAVSALSNSYRARQRGITRQLYARASAEMKAGNPQRAARSFRAVLDLTPDNFSSQLGLAEALMAGQRDREALAYLQVLWEREPENGRVNLELARVYAGRGDRDRAIRHYQNAIYAVWEADTDGNRRAVRLELVHYLLDYRATNQAEAELVALAGNLPEDPTLRNQVAALFLQVGSYARSLAQYERVLGIDPENREALAGAGRAAFLGGQYVTAERHLAEAIRQDPNNSELTDLLQTANIVLAIDPLSRRISDAERSTRVLGGFG
jgi:predicted Zn-dependent protease